MSKRYGRNQKRAHRQMIAGLQEKLVQAHRFSAEQACQAQKALQAIDMANNVLGRGTVVTPPQTYQVDKLPAGNSFEFGLALAPSDSLTALHDADSLHFKTVTLHRLLTRVAAAEWSDAVHFQLRMYGHSVGYVASKAALERLNKQQLAHHLASDIAPALAKGLAEAIKRPPLHVD